MSTTVGDILSSGKRDIAAYIDRLKALYGVREDQELAAALGSTKAAVSKWRKRGAIPAAIENRVAQQFGPQWFRQLGDDHFQSRFGQDAYAITLQLLTVLPNVSWDELSPNDTRNIALKGAVFGAILHAVRRHIESNLADVDSGSGIIERCLADFAEGRIDGLEEASTIGWLTFAT